MTTCANCGAPLGVGRFCTNCGHRVGAAIVGPTDTAERPAVPAGSTPPPVHEAPPPARFPLFADSDADSDAGTDATRGDLPPVAAPGAVQVAATDAPTRRRVVIVGAALAVLLVVGLVAVVVGRGDDAAPAARSGDTSEPDATRPSEASGPTAGDGEQDDRPTDESPADGVERDLSRNVAVTAPVAAPPSTDVATGLPVTYVASHLVDGDPTTCWRTPGDATGEELVFRLRPGSSVTSISIVNGYAKTSRAAGRVYDWYAGNRRVLRAEWSFDDGTVIAQDLIDTRLPQRLDLGSIRTDTVRLRLLEVSAPGTGPAAKDNTAISEVTIRGA